MADPPYPVGGDPKGWDSSFLPIIPGLPDDLALHCLAKVSHGYHGILECVSKRWKEAMRSTDYSALKARQGSSGNWLFVLTEDSLCWEAYDPEADRWHPLPTMSRPKPGYYHLGFSCVAVSKMLLVLGGFYAPSPSKHGPSYMFLRTKETEDVMLFNPFKKKWREVASMGVARSDFACAVICGKVYVAGGSQGVEGLSSAEVYDPVQDRWEDLPLMPVPLIDCFSISHGGKFHVIGKSEKIQYRPSIYVIFDPSRRQWEVINDIGAFNLLTRQATLAVEDHIFTIHEASMTVSIINTNDRGLYDLTGPPLVVLPHHSRALKPFGYGFLELQGKFYVVGGKALKYNDDAQEFGIVKLNVVRFSDLARAPSDWREATPMSQSCGGVVGCASLEEECSVQLWMSYIRERKIYGVYHDIDNI